MTAARSLSLLCVTAALAVTPASASAAGAIRVVKVEPGAAVSGAAIDIRGKGLKGKGTRVRIGGKKAAILAARKTRLRVLVPRLKAGKHKLVVKRGCRSASARLRVLKPFD